MLLSWILRAELAGLGEQVLFGDHQLYNVLITSTIVAWWMAPCCWVLMAV